MGNMSFDDSIQNKNSEENILIVSYQLLQIFDFSVMYLISFKFLLKRKHTKKTELQGPPVIFLIFVKLGSGLKAWKVKVSVLHLSSAFKPLCACEHVCSVVWGVFSTSQYLFCSGTEPTLLGTI